MSDRKRNASIELYRLLLMYGICLLHACIGPGYCKAWLVNCTCFCVTAFAFLTGYFGSRFRVSKVLRIAGTGIVCALICARGNVACALDIYKGYWFLHAYVFMMCLAPLVDSAIDAADRAGSLNRILPLLAVVYVWMHATSLPVIGSIVPTIPEFASYNGTHLLAAYAAARLYRLYDLDNRLRTGWCLMLLPVLFVLAAVGFNESCSLVALGLSGVTLFLTSRIWVPKWLGAIVLFLSPSCFSIYLLHQPNIGIETGWVKSYVDQGGGIYVAYFVFSAAVFGLALVADMPRRLLARVLHRPIEVALQKSDELYDRMIVGVFK